MVGAIACGYPENRMPEVFYCAVGIDKGAVKDKVDALQGVLGGLVGTEL